jgi:hypothetical protein
VVDTFDRPLDRGAPTWQGLLRGWGMQIKTLINYKIRRRLMEPALDGPLDRGVPEHSGYAGGA